MSGRRRPTVASPSAAPLPERGRLLGDLLDALPVPVDLLVYTPEEFARGMARGMDLFHTLAEEGATRFERAAASSIVSA